MALRDTYAMCVTVVAAEGARLLLYCFLPGQQKEHGGDGRGVAKASALPRLVAPARGWDGASWVRRGGSRT
ncbi:MAG: hypothetical protein M3075_16720, partial [Candidatus Dormibacteraeota bacterium]|nr:hypothetical protein [Candidatus Dormibacteraeota bacterium]